MAIVALCALLEIILLSFQYNLENTYKEELEEVVQFTVDDFDSSISEKDKLFTLSIGAPELICYSYVQNFLETTVLELMYIQHGASVVDFSIGPFQMKPSFIEKLECKISASETLKAYQFLAIYSSENSAKRLERMQSVEYQIHYLLAFRAYCEHHKISFFRLFLNRLLTLDNTNVWYQEVYFILRNENLTLCMLIHSKKLIQLFILKSLFLLKES